MTTFEAYKLYLALRLHFTTDNYDIRKTKGRVKASEKALAKNMKLQFYLRKLKSKYREQDFINYLVANFIAGDRWGGVYSTDTDDKYMAWQRIHDSLSYVYKQDLQKLYDEGITTVQQLWDCNEGHPPILKKHFGQICCLETVVILNKLFKFNDMIDEQLIFDPVWSTFSKLIHKYSPFVRFDKQQFYQITYQVFDHESQ